MEDKQIICAAKKYSSMLDFSNSTVLNKKGEKRVVEWAERDFIAGANWKKEQKNLITFYNKKGKMLGQAKLKNASTHKERCKIAEDIGLNNWFHYEMRDSGVGMKKKSVISDKNFHGWYKIKYGLIISKVVCD